VPTESTGIDATLQQHIVVPQELVLFARKLGESPRITDQRLLFSRKSKARPPESLNHVVLVLILRPHAHQHRADLDSSGRAHGLTPRVTHSRLQSICSCAGKHFVDSRDVEWLHSDTTVEAVFATHSDQISIGSDSRCLQSLRGDLDLLLGHKVDDQREQVHGSLPAPDIEDADFGVGHTTAISRFDPWLTLALAVALPWPTSHCLLISFDCG